MIPICPDMNMFNYNILFFNVLSFTFHLIVICGLLKTKILLKFLSRFVGRLYCRERL